MNKVIKDGKVAILISGGYGAGFYSWNGYEEILLFSPKIVEMVEQGKSEEITTDWIFENLGIENVYCGGVDNLDIYWIPVGTNFTVIEQDGKEELITLDDLGIVA